MAERVNGWRVWPSKNRAGEVVAWNAQRERVPGSPGYSFRHRYDYVSAATAVELAQLIGAPSPEGRTA